MNSDWRRDYSYSGYGRSAGRDTDRETGRSTRDAGNESARTSGTNYRDAAFDDVSSGGYGSVIYGTEYGNAGASWKSDTYTPGYSATNYGADPAYSDRRSGARAYDYAAPAHESRARGYANEYSDASQSRSPRRNQNNGGYRYGEDAYTSTGRTAYGANDDSYSGNYTNRRASDRYYTGADSYASYSSRYTNPVPPRRTDYSDANPDSRYSSGRSAYTREPYYAESAPYARRSYDTDLYNVDGEAAYARQRYRDAEAGSGAAWSSRADESRSRAQTQERAYRDASYRGDDSRQNRYTGQSYSGNAYKDASTYESPYSREARYNGPGSDYAYQNSGLGARYSPDSQNPRYAGGETYYAPPQEEPSYRRQSAPQEPRVQPRPQGQDSPRATMNAQGAQMPQDAQRPIQEMREPTQGQPDARRAAPRAQGAQPQGVNSNSAQQTEPLFGQSPGFDPRQARPGAPAQQVRPQAVRPQTAAPQTPGAPIRQPAYGPAQTPELFTDGAPRTRQAPQDQNARLERMRMAGEAALRAQGYKEEDVNLFMNTGRVHVPSGAPLNEGGVDPIISAQQTARMAIIKQAQLDASSASADKFSAPSGHSRPGYGAEEIEDDTGKKSVGRSVLEWVLLLALAAGVALLIRTYVAGFYRVLGTSMTPTLSTGERVLVDKIGYVIGDIDRFDIVVCHYPNSDEYYVKRVIALPGETISITKGTVFINGQALKEDYVHFSDDTSMSETVVAAGSYMVMGDNRVDSYDSRDIGAISRKMIVGRVAAVAWPVSDWKSVARLEEQVGNADYISLGNNDQSR